MDTFKPDIVYIHNTWFKANLGIFDILKKENVEVVLKIHNFRFACTDTLVPLSISTEKTFVLNVVIKKEEWVFLISILKIHI